MDIVPSFCIGDVELVEMEHQCIDDLIALLYNCNFLGNAHNIKEIRDEIKECVNVNSNESKKTYQNLLEDIDDVIVQASNTIEPLAYDENDSVSKLAEMQDMRRCSREEDAVIPEYCNTLLIVKSCLIRS